ncbi:ABC transporter substrate-binding protein [Rhizobium wenxiniae]|nr:ABC transporter substrate-binding protein [Rhizobium wenxiniae]
MPDRTLCWSGILSQGITIFPVYGRANLTVRHRNLRIPAVLQLRGRQLQTGEFHMFTFTLRRLFFAIPTLLVISFVIFALLDLAPNDPTGDLPLTIPPEVREQIRASLGLDQPFFFRYLAWLHQFFINEPLNIIESLTGWQFGDGERMRVLSWATRSPVVDLIVQRLPQTLWVVGLAYLFGILIAIPIGVISAYKQYSVLDQVGTFISMVGYSVPTFFTGVLLVVIFSSYLQWFPSVYDTNLRVTDFSSFVAQVKQMVLPVAVLSLYNASQIARFVRASMLDNLHQDYVRTARAKGVKEKAVLLVHVLRNSLIPVVTVIALGVPTIFSGAIITEQIFRVNGLGQLLITAVQGADIPLVQTLTFIFAVLIVLFNLIADVLYGILDPRIRYD